MEKQAPTGSGGRLGSSSEVGGQQRNCANNNRRPIADLSAGPPASYDDDDDVIGALIYKESRTAKAARAEEERRAAASADRGVLASDGEEGADAAERRHSRKDNTPSAGGKQTKRKRTFGKAGTAWLARAFGKRREQLKAYKAKHGHLDVKMTEDKSLAIFIRKVRSERRNPARGTMKMTEERIAALDALGFDWTPRRHYKSFEERLEDLKAYKAERGHLHVKQSEDESLYQFCASARRGRKCPSNNRNMRMAKDRIASLDAIGFVWDPKSQR